MNEEDTHENDLETQEDINWTTPWSLRDNEIVKNACSFPGADVNSDYNLIAMK